MPKSNSITFDPQLQLLATTTPVLPVSIVAYLTGRSCKRVRQWLAEGNVQRVTIAGAVYVNLPSLLTYLATRSSQTGKVTSTPLSLPSKHRRRS